MVYRTPLTCIVFILFVCLTGASNENSLASCLNEKGVHNFTTAQSDATAFVRLLYFSLQNLRFSEPGVRRPVAIVLPQSAKQVQYAWSCILQGNWALRVRSGGHSYEGLSSTADAPFVILDLMSMRAVNVDVLSRTAWVEAGATLGEVYYAISQKTSSYGFSAGSCATVGVGGQFSGGGYGLLSRKYGVAADNIMEAQLVNASGSLVERVSVTDEELFWALRGGGGGSWGIVVAWKIKLVAVPSRVTTFSLSKSGRRNITELVYRWQTVAAAAPEELYLGVYMAGTNRSGRTDTEATFYGQYLGSMNETTDVLNEIFPELGKLTAGDGKEGTWIEAVASMAYVSSPRELTSRQTSSKSYFKAKSDYITVTASRHALEGALQILEKNPKGYMLLDPYGGVMDKISSHSIAFPHRAGNLYSIQYQVTWDGEQDHVFIEWVRSLYNYMAPYASASPRASNVNYVDLDLGDGGSAGHSYFLHNFARLVKIKGRVDPHNLFNNSQSLPPHV